MMILGACGDKCSVCPRYLATVNNDRERLQAILDLYIRMGHRPAGFDLELLKCRGCKTVTDCAYPELKKCVETRKLDNCGQCEAYPCPKIKEAFAKTVEYFRRLEKNSRPEEIRMFADAFAGKRRYLDGIRRKQSGRKNRRLRAEK